MNVNFNINLSEEETTLLAQIFQIEPDNPPERPIGTKDAELEEKVSSISEAAGYEYIRMVLGQKIFTRGQDIKEYRLLLLIKYFFYGSIPDEQMITTLFQTTNTESKSLLRSVLAKYQYELRPSIEHTITNILRNDLTPGENATEDVVFYVSNIPVNIIDEMNKTLSSINGALTQISKKRGSLNTFEIANSSCTSLKAYYGIEAE